MPSLLNVGSGALNDIPPHYAGWKHVRLDINPASGAELVCDARRMRESVPPASFDAIYCCHNLEHYHPHEGALVLSGFQHVLKADGYAEIRVPDVGEILADVARRGLDIEDELYASPAGPIRVLDALHGWQEQIERTGEDFYAHKTSFTWKSLLHTLNRAGFRDFCRLPPMALYELRVIAFKQAPTAAQRTLFGSPA
jgi:SAM-dependent methyltransferase